MLTMTEGVVESPPPDRLMGRQVSVYFDSTRRVFSVKSKGLVAAKAWSVFLTEVRFVVRPYGRLKVLREGRKTPHAFVVGTVVGLDGANPSPRWMSYAVPFNYNPAKHEGFTSLSGGSVLTEAASAFMTVVERRPRCFYLDGEYLRYSR